jgi:hypothetical protein
VQKEDNLELLSMPYVIKFHLIVLLLLPELVLESQVVVYTLHSPGVHKSQVSGCLGG